MKPYKNHIKFLGVIALGSLSITACQPLSSKFHIGPKLGIKIPLEERSAEDYKKPTEDLAEDKDPVFSQLKNDNSDALEQNTGKNQTFIGNGQFVSRRSGSDSPKPKGSGKYSLNFDGADLGEVTKIILTDMLQKNYIMSPRVSGNVSLQTTDPLHKEELLPTLEMLLRINGAVLIKKDGIYRIETAIDGVQIAGASSMSGKNLKPGYQIKIIPLKYVGAADMAETIKPVLSKAILKIDPARNLLLAAGTKDELNKILELVRTFDVNFIEGMSFGLYPLENTEVESIVAEIDKVFNKGEKTPLSGMLKIISIKHLNSILVVTPQKAYLAEVEKWIKRFDIVNASGGEGGVTVYRVQHVDAVKLASTLTQVISGIASTKGKNASIAPGLKRATITNRNRRTNRGSTNKKSGTANASLEGVGIIADEVNNALVITARPQQYRTLHKIIKQLDVMPLQVLVDATIISVNLTDKLEYGVKWALTDAFSSGFTNAGARGDMAITKNPLSDLATAAASAAAGGFSYGIVNNSGAIRAALNLLASEKKIDVISTPSVMVLNNHEATIKVGDQVPIRTSQSTNLNGGANISTSPIQMVDTGVTLKVKPRVNANGVVIMEIEQKVDNVSNSNSGSNIDSPTILQRQITSSVAVVSGESIVLGGLMDETHTDSNTGIPLLKDIPYLGWLFGSQSKDIAKQELIVIITPRVVENKFDARKVTDEFKRKLTGIFYNRKDYQLKSGETLRDYSGQTITVDE